MTSIYLDHQASTPLNPLALEAMISCLRDTYANPHSDDHAAGWAAANAIEVARAQVADAIGAEADEVVFTSGATEANNIAILGAAEAVGSRRGRIVVTAVEHKAVLAPARALARRGFELVVVPVAPDGTLRLDDLTLAIDEQTVLVSVGAVNNEIGTVQPLRDVAAICRKRDALLHTDATQALSWQGIDVASSGVDLASFSAHKAGGPKGIGALYVSQSARGRIEPISFGGGQEEGLRPGTLPTPLCVGFGAASADLPDALSVLRWRELTQDLFDRLKLALPEVRMNGPATSRHPGNLSVTLPGTDADALVARLQPMLALARGSACSSGIPEPSHVLTAIGLHPAEASATIRFSTGVMTTPEEIVRAVDHVASAFHPRS